MRCRHDAKSSGEPRNTVRARLLKASYERQEDFTLTLMNYGAERLLSAVRVGEHYRPTRDLDFLGLGARLNSMAPFSTNRSRCFDFASRSPCESR